MNESIATLFEAIAGELGEQTAFRHGQSVLSWAEFDRRASCLAGYFVSRGMKPGSTVAIDLYTGMEYLEVVYGAMKARVAPVNVNLRYRETELRYLFSDCRPAAVVFHDRLAEPVVAAAGHVPGLDVRLQVGAEPHAGHGVDSYEAVLATFAPAFPIRRSKDDQLILYTGGTTGAPKGTLWRHEDLFASWANNYDREGVDRPTTLEGVRARRHRSRRAPRVGCHRGPGDIRAYAGRLSGRRSQDQRHVPHHRWCPLRRTRRPGDPGCRRHAGPPGSRERRHQQRGREGLRRGGRAGLGQPPRRSRHLGGGSSG